MTEPISVTVERAAELLSVSRDTVYRAIKRREVVAKKLGGRWVVSVASLERLFEDAA